jgi:thioredoxin reductase
MDGRRHGAAEPRTIDGLPYPGGRFLLKGFSMSEDLNATHFDLAIVGGGPAGLTAALVAARCRLQVAVFDDDRPRNEAARALHGFPGFDGVTPFEFREAIRRDVARYPVRFVSRRVVAARCTSTVADLATGFELTTDVGEVYSAGKILLATGTRDELAAIPHLARFYGKSVHHCPYCDGWEERDRRIACLAPAEKILPLAEKLHGWSEHLIACTNGEPVAPIARQKLEALGARLYERPIRSLEGRDEQLERIEFDDGSSIPCDTLFFSGPQHQATDLAERLGCRTNEKRLLIREGKRGSGVRGVFLAGDVDGDTQLAVVAAAEGAVAAIAIHGELVEESTRRREIELRTREREVLARTAV